MQPSETTQQFALCQNTFQIHPLFPSPLLPSWGKPPPSLAYHTPRASSWSPSCPLPIVYPLQQSEQPPLKSRWNHVTPLLKNFYLLKTQPTHRFSARNPVKVLNMAQQAPWDQFPACLPNQVYCYLSTLTAVRGPAAWTTLRTESEMQSIRPSPMTCWIRIF